jgi:cell division protein FtsQ
MSPRKNSELTRAELIRQRRSQQSNNRQKSSAMREAWTIPPVTTRSKSTYVAPARNKKSRKSSTRQYAVAVNLPGAQVRMPALPSIQLSWRWASMVLTALLVAALYWLWTSPQFAVSNAEVTGNVRLSTGDINSVLALNGRAIFTVNPRGLEQALRVSFPDLASVSISVVFPNRVNVRVSERTPIIAWQQDNALAWIDAQGVAFPPRGQVEGLIPVIAGGAPPKAQAASSDPLSAPAFLSSGLLNALQILAPYVPDGSAILYDPTYGMGWKDNRGWEVYFGQNSGEMTLKLRIYQALQDDLTKKGITPSLISVAYPDAPFYR